MEPGAEQGRARSRGTAIGHEPRRSISAGSKELLKNPQRPMFRAIIRGKHVVENNVGGGRRFRDREREIAPHEPPLQVWI